MEEHGNSQPSSAKDSVQSMRQFMNSSTALPGMVNHGPQKERTEVRVDPAGTTDGERPSRTDGSNPHEVNGSGRRRSFLKRYWSKVEQQEVPASTLPMRAFRTPTQIFTSSCCAVLFGVLSCFLLTATGSFEETVVSYSFRDNSSKAFTIDKEIKGPVLVWYEIPDLMLNYKHVVQSKDNFLWNGLVSEYQCDNAETLKDVQWRRPAHSFNMMLGSGGVQEFRPCGLVVLAMYTDTFDVMSSTGAKINLDSSDLALEEDEKLYGGKFVPISGRVSPPMYTLDATDSWASDAALQRLKVWYRTPVSPLVRHLYARITDSLPAGQYSLSFSVNDPVYEANWDVPEKRIVFSEQRALGSVGAYRSLGIFCAMGAIVEVLVCISFLVAPSFVTKLSRTAPETVVTASYNKG